MGKAFYDQNDCVYGSGKPFVPLRSISYASYINEKCKNIKWVKVSLQKLRRKDIPFEPGVYYFKLIDKKTNEHDIVYVGMSENLAVRITTHSQLAYLKHAFRNYYHIVIYYAVTDRGMACEAYLIEKISPMFNVLGKPRRSLMP